MEQILSSTVVQSAPEWTPQVMASFIMALTTLIGAIAGLIALFKKTENTKKNVQANLHQTSLNKTRLDNVERLVNATGTTTVKKQPE